MCLCPEGSRYPYSGIVNGIIVIRTDQIGFDAGKVYLTAIRVCVVIRCIVAVVGHLVGIVNTKGSNVNDKWASLEGTYE